MDEVVHDRAMKLSQDRIVAAAFDQLQEEGFEALSMRTLAKRLGVQQSSLYRHIASKEDLISLMVNTIHRAAFHSVAPTENWRAFLVQFGTAFRAGLSRVRDSAKLCVLAGPWPDKVSEIMDELYLPLRESGISMQAAMKVHTAVVSFTIGWLVFEQNERFNNHLAQMIDFSSDFDLGLNALAKGFEA